MSSIGFSKYSIIALVSIFDNSIISLFINGIMNKKTSDNTKNINIMVMTAETASPSLNFLI